MMIKEIAKNERPREKAKIYGLKSLSDSELFALILGSGTKCKGVLELAQDIVKLIDSERKINNITLQEIQGIKGVGEAKSLQIASIFELVTRGLNKKNIDIRINSSYDVYSYLKEKYLDDFENFIVFYFDKSGKYIAEKVYSIRNVGKIDVDINEIIRWAIKHASFNIIVAHNHPSNNILPSQNDLDSTELLANKLSLFNIRLLDHIIFSESDYYSFKKERDDLLQ